MPCLRMAFAAVLAASQLGAQNEPDFSWSSRLDAGTLVSITNVNGEISVVPASGDRIEVVAVKRWRRGNPAAVSIRAARVDDAVQIAVTHSDRRRAGDVAVSFVVKLPAGMRLAVTNVNGDVSIETESRVVTAETTNGNVVVISSQGRLVASTVNGSITAYLADPVHADVDLQSRGILQSDFALLVGHSIRPGRLQARIGNGGRTVRLTTTYGGITLRRRSRGSAPIR